MVSRLIRINNVELQEQSNVGAIKLLVVGKTDVAAPPAAAEGSADGVGAIGEQFCYVVGLVLDAFLVRRPAGGKVILRYSTAIDLCSVHATRSDVGGCRKQLFPGCKFLAEHGAWVRGVFRRGKRYPLRFPVGGA